jgi:CheY-like chemotaxis protein
MELKSFWCNDFRERTLQKVPTVLRRKGPTAMIFPSTENQGTGRATQTIWANKSRQESSWPTVLLATSDLEIRDSISSLLQLYPVNTMWVRGMEETRRALSTRNVAACFCGFWLVDGTYRDVVRHLKRQPLELPVIIVCAPTCPDEYRDYLAALNIRAFDFLCHPYRKTDLEKILQSAIRPNSLLVPVPSGLGAEFPTGPRPAS